MMKRKMTLAVGIATCCVAAALAIQFRYGIGSCGPASNTPLLVVALGIGPSCLLASFHPVAVAFEAAPHPAVLLAFMFLVSALAWSAVFFGVAVLAGLVRKLVVRQSSE